MPRFKNLPFSKILVEIFSVVFAVLLALWVNEWRSVLEHRDLAGTALEHLLAEVRHMRVIMNLDANEAYPLGEPKDRLRAIDVDFMHRTRLQTLRAQALSRLSEDELAALGLRKG